MAARCVCWASTDAGDGSGDCVRGRRIDAGGTLPGGDVVINSVTAGNQLYPAVAGLPSGGFAACWISLDDNEHGKVRMRTFHALGIPASADVPVGTDAAAQEFNPDVAGFPDGRSAIVWSEQAAQAAIRGALISVDGIPGGAFAVTSATVPFDGAPKVSALPDGRFVVTWAARLPGEEVGSAIVARYFTATPLVGGEEIIVAGNEGVTQTDVAVAANANGEVLVAWTSFDPDDGELSDIRAAILGPEVAARAVSGSLTGSLRPRAPDAAARPRAIEGRARATGTSSPAAQGRILASDPGHRTPRGRRTIALPRRKRKPRHRPRALPAQG